MFTSFKCWLQHLLTKLKDHSFQEQSQIWYPMRGIAPIHQETLVDAGWHKDLPAFSVMASSIAVKAVVKESEFDSDYIAGSSTR